MEHRLANVWRVGRPRPHQVAAAAAISLVVALALAAAGCGSKTIDHSSEVDLINKQLESQKLKAKSVDCPDDVEAKEGETFECNVALTNGRTGTYTVAVEKVSGDSASLRVTGAKNTNK